MKLYTVEIKYPDGETRFLERTPKRFNVDPNVKITIKQITDNGLVDF